MLFRVLYNRRYTAGHRTHTTTTSLSLDTPITPYRLVATLAFLQHTRTRSNHQPALPLSYVYRNGLLSQPSGTSRSLHHAHKRLRPVRVYQEDIRTYLVTSDASLTSAKIHTAPTCRRHEHIALSSTNTPPRRTSTSSSSSTRTQFTLASHNTVHNDTN